MWPIVLMIFLRASARPTLAGIHCGSDALSAGLPSMYFGSTHTPRRIEMNSLSAIGRWESSEEMSIAELPVPTTITVLPRKSYGVERVAVVVGVDRYPSNVPGYVGHARVPVVAVGDDQRVVAPRLTGRQRHRPPAAGERRASVTRGVERDRLAQAEVVDVVVEVLQELGVVREVGPVARHRVVLERQPPLGGVDVQRLVAGR